jgi:hypothetical protein
LIPSQKKIFIQAIGYKPPTVTKRYQPLQNCGILIQKPYQEFTEERIRLFLFVKQKKMAHTVHTLLSCMVFMFLPTGVAGLGAEAPELVEKHPSHIPRLGVVAARGLGVPAPDVRAAAP